MCRGAGHLPRQEGHAGRWCRPAVQLVSSRSRLSSPLHGLWGTGYARALARHRNTPSGLVFGRWQVSRLADVRGILWQMSCLPGLQASGFGHLLRSRSRGRLRLTAFLAADAFPFHLLAQTPTKGTCGKQRGVVKRMEALSDHRDGKATCSGQSAASALIRSCNQVSKRRAQAVGRVAPSERIR